MHPCRWVVYIQVVMVVSLMIPGLRGTASAQASDEDKVSFVWAFEALVAEGKITKQVSVKEDMTLKTGDQLKMFVELRKPCFVYVIHHGARGEIQRLFPYDIQQFTTDYQTSKIYEIPPHDAWFRINEQAGRETFYLLASGQRLTDLEQLLATYTAGQPAEQPLAATNILAELRNLLKQHRSSVKPGRPVPIAGNMRKGIEGVEITAPQFYIETFTIEHS
ncbi:MAG TPA: DUF4384 domain-containing protein [Candidatus Tectomicrobia bacterium]